MSRRIGSPLVEARKVNWACGRANFQQEVAARGNDKSPWPERLREFPEISCVYLTNESGDKTRAGNQGLNASAV